MKLLKGVDLLIGTFLCEKAVRRDMLITLGRYLRIKPSSGLPCANGQAFGKKNQNVSQIITYFTGGIDNLISSVQSGAVGGINSYLMTVETDLSDGLPSFTMVGFLSREVKEAGERVRVAIKNSGIRIPPSRITINFSPANIPKRDVVLDLPVAVGILICLEAIPQEAVRNILILGELGLDGRLHPVRGVLPIVRQAVENGITTCILPVENAAEGAQIMGSRIIWMRNLKELIHYFSCSSEERRQQFPVYETDRKQQTDVDENQQLPDFSDIRGQETAKRGIEIAAAGFHNLLMCGAPGAGKSMLAKAIPGILPPLTDQEILEVSTVYSISGMLSDQNPLVRRRPFVEPHHSATVVSLTGGGSIPRPGMISMAHCGVLFLDEMPEFRREVLDSLRQPMESRHIHITRNLASYDFPTRFMLVGAMNPCPCGYYPDLSRCSCSLPMIHKYQQRISGPILDRIDLQIRVEDIGVEQLLQKNSGRTSREVQENVIRVLQIQKNRFEGSSICFNADMSISQIEKYCELDESLQKFMCSAFEKMKLSARAYHRVLKVARTIADLAGEDRIREEHLLEAIGFRNGGDRFFDY